MRHCQFVHCSTAVNGLYGWGLSLDNCLLYDLTTGFAGDDLIVDARHLTVDGCNTLTSGNSSTIALTNSLLIGVTYEGSYTFTNNSVARALSSTGIFTNVNGSAHYLAAGSTNRNAGTTNIGSLLAELRQLTTYPPLAIQSNLLYTNMNLFPIVPRDTDAPDLGYHAEPIDFIFGGAAFSNSVVTIYPGTAIGTFGVSPSLAYGIGLLYGTSLISEGSPTNPVRIVRFTAVQEQANTNWSTIRGASILGPWNGGTQPSARFRFTEFSTPGQDIAHIDSSTYGRSLQPMPARDCQFHGGRVCLGSSALFTNCLFEGSYLNLNDLNDTADMIFQNNLFYWTTNYVDHEDVGVWKFRDNFFDNCGISGYPAFDAVDGDWNAYVTNTTRLNSSGTNDLILASNVVYQTGTFGYYYLPTNCPMIDRGSVTNAGLMGLFYYCSTTNNLREGSSRLNQSFHYIATTNGTPVDTDADGVPDWQENLAGDGVQHIGETDWQTADSEFIVRSEPLGPCSRRTPLVISEIMYNPTNSGRSDEFIEIYNSHHLNQDLSGYRLILNEDDELFTFPTNTTIGPYGFLVVVGNLSHFTNVANTAGPTANNLPNFGPAQIRLLNQMGAVLLNFRYDCDPPWPASADGPGHSLVLYRPSYGEADARAWKASAFRGGSPGQPEPSSSDLLNAIKINEFLANPTNGEPQFIELYNQSRFPVEISGSFLGTRRNNLTNLTIPSPTVLLPRSFIAFNQGTNAGQFSTGLATGDPILFTRPDQKRIIDSIVFKGQDVGISSGRFPDGNPIVRELSSRTAGASNSNRLQRDVFINEILFNPVSGSSGDEFVEIYNRGASSISLSNWTLTGIEMSFFTNVAVTLAPSNFIVVAKSPTQLAAKYPNLIIGSNLVGGYSKTLKNSGDHLLLANANNANGVIVDDVTFADRGRSGRWTDGGGSTLELIDPRSDHRLAPSWADSDSPAQTNWTTISTTGLLQLGNATNIVANALEISLLGAGECLIDNVSVLPQGGSEKVANGGFDSGTSGWTFDGDYDQSSWQSSGGVNGGCLFVCAAGRGDYTANRIVTAWSTAIPTGSTCTISASVKWLRGNPELLLRLRGNYLEATAARQCPALARRAQPTPAPSPTPVRRFPTSAIGRYCRLPANLCSLLLAQTTRMV